MVVTTPSENLSTFIALEHEVAVLLHHMAACHMVLVKDNILTNYTEPLKKRRNYVFIYLFIHVHIYIYFYIEH
jgi:hypothetical protein